jgi:hypothetical protein
MMTKLFVIDTHSTEYHIYAMDVQDALETFDGNPNDIDSIAEYENPSSSERLH